MDAAWHSSLYEGYDELPANAIPPSPEPSKGLGSGKASRRELVDIAATSHAQEGSNQAQTGHSRSSIMAQNKADGASARKALRMTSSARRARPEERGFAAAARLEAAEKPLRSLNVAMHGLEALTALHKVTKGELQPGHQAGEGSRFHYWLALYAGHTIMLAHYNRHCSWLACISLLESDTAGTALNCTRQNCTNAT